MAVPQTVFMYKDDLLPVLQITLLDSSGNPINLSSVVGVYLNAGLSTDLMKITGAVCSITDPINGKAQYSWQQGDTDTANDYQAEIVIKYSGNKTQTAGQFTLSILDSLH